MGHYNLTKHAYAWKNGRWDYGTGYYAMMSDVPKGLEYAQKAKLNILKLEMEEMERKVALEEFKKLEDERKKKEAMIDPEMAALNAEFIKYFIEGLRYTINKDIEVYDEELKDLYTEDSKPNVLI
jgi:rubrerythrin